MKLYNRAQLNETEKAQVQYAKNKNGEKIDPNSKQALKPGKIDLGHRYGYEEHVMQKCAKRCRLFQKDYNRMMRNPRLYQWEDRSQNRSHANECKNYKVQIHKCMQIIRNYKNSENGKNTKSARERNSGRSFSTLKGYSSKAFSGKGRLASSVRSAKADGKSAGESGIGGAKAASGNRGGKGTLGGLGAKGASGSAGGKGGAGGFGGVGGSGGMGVGGKGGTGGFGGMGGGGKGGAGGSGSGHGK